MIKDRTQSDDALKNARFKSEARKRNDELYKSWVHNSGRWYNKSAENEFSITSEIVKKEDDEWDKLCKEFSYIRSAAEKSPFYLSKSVYEIQPHLNGHLVKLGNKIEYDASLQALASEYVEELRTRFGLNGNVFTPSESMVYVDGIGNILTIEEAMSRYDTYRECRWVYKVGQEKPIENQIGEIVWSGGLPIKRSNRNILVRVIRIKNSLWFIDGESNHQLIRFAKDYGESNMESYVVPKPEPKQPPRTEGRRDDHEFDLTTWEVWAYDLPKYMIQKERKYF